MREEKAKVNLRTLLRRQTLPLKLWTTVPDPAVFDGDATTLSVAERASPAAVGLVREVTGGNSDTLNIR
jgi:hypothetical protein